MKNRWMTVIRIINSALGMVSKGTKNKKTRKIRYQRKNRYYPDYSIVAYIYIYIYKRIKFHQRLEQKIEYLNEIMKNHV